MTRSERDTIDVLLWLHHRAGAEVSYQDIAAGVDIPVSNRLRKAVCEARKAAAESGDRLELFQVSRDPLRRHGYTTRYQRSGTGDEFGARDALLACRKSVASMAEMKRACDFEATNPNSLDAQAFGQMAATADGAMRLISGVEGLGNKVMSNQERMKAMAARIADLEAQVSEMTEDSSTATA